MLFPIFFSSFVLVNSQDWHTVFLGGYYANVKNYDWYFLRNVNDSQFAMYFIPDGEDVILIENKPFVDVLPLLKAKNCSVRVIRGDYKQIQEALHQEIGGKIYLFSDDPRIALGCGFLAFNDNGFVMFSDGHYAPTGDVILVGHFSPKFAKQVKPLAIIDKGSPSATNILCVERSLKLKPTNHAYVSNDLYLEKDLITGHGDPVIFLGMDQLRRDILKFLKGHNITTLTLVGYEAVPLGEAIREKSNRTIRVIIKFGQSFTGIPGKEGKVYALNLFPLPNVKPDVLITNAIWNNGQLYLTVLNNGTAGFYTIRLHWSNTTVSSPVRLIANDEIQINAFNITTLPSIIHATILMGDEPNNLYRVREQSINIKKLKLPDPGLLHIDALTYNGRYLKLRLSAESDCQKPVIAVVELYLNGEKTNIIMKGQISKEGVLIKHIDIADEEIEANKNVSVILRYGCGAIYKEIHATTKLEREIEKWYILVAIVLVIVLAAIIMFLKQKR